MSYIAVSCQARVGKVIDNGHCVRFVQVMCAELPHTSKWRKGAWVRGAKIPSGTIIATFDDKNRYANATDGSSHAAVYEGETAEGLLVYDQWIGRPVSMRTIRFKDGMGPPCDDGDAFYVVERDMG